MTPSGAAFERALGRLDAAGARAFVADLLGARGYRTAVEGPVVTATGGPGGSMRLLVVADGRSLVPTWHRRSFDAVVVTGGPVAAAAGAVAVRAARRRDGGRPDVLGADTLYEWFTFTVDSETRAELADRYLRATEPTALSRTGVALADGYGAARSWLGRPTLPRTAWAVLVALFLLVAATATGPFGPVGPATNADGRGSTPARPTPGFTSVPVSVTPVPATSGAGRSVPDVCPPAPVGAHPAALRPGVILTASADGLEGWRVLATQNLTRYEFDPNDQRRILVPEVRHVAVFETVGGMPVRLGLDRWESPAGAEAAVARGGPWNLGFSWGAYAVWVEWRSRGPASDASARLLLASVTTPDGIKLGGECVSALLAGPPTKATARSAVRGRNAAATE